ncbi:hypothetical protein HMPREF0497_1762 [Lentilactobacillus buchneri ATCC 11577]|nr:hypothetical protein HMPREF0497_1762 [Lentilactobacillus buchneri ATCC 11577]
MKVTTVTEYKTKQSEKIFIPEPTSEIKTKKPPISQRLSLPNSI